MPYHYGTDRQPGALGPISGGGMPFVGNPRFGRVTRSGPRAGNFMRGGGMPNMPRNRFGMGMNGVLGKLLNWRFRPRPQFPIARPERPPAGMVSPPMAGPSPTPEFPMSQPSPNPFAPPTDILEREHAIKAPTEKRFQGRIWDPQGEYWKFITKDIGDKNYFWDGDDRGWIENRTNYAQFHEPQQTALRGLRRF